MTTLTWQNPQALQLQNSIRTLEINLQEYKDYIKREEVNLSVTNGVEYLFTRLNTEFLGPLNVDTLEQGETAKQRLINIIEHHLQLTLHGRDNIRDNIGQYNSLLNSAYTQIAALKERLENVDTSSRTVSQADVRKALSVFKGIKSPNSILLKEKEGQPYLRFVLNPVISRLDSSTQYELIHSEVGDLHIPISPVIVKINLITGDTAITPYTGWSSHAVYKFDGGYSPHPHVLGTYPCLGDFAAPFREAVENQEWLETALFIKLFLERIITGDVAGKNWIQYFGVWCNLRTDADFIYYQGKRYNIWQTKQPGYYELRPFDSEGPVVPHPANNVFFPGV